MEHIILLHSRLQFTISVVLVLLLVWGLLAALRGRVDQGYTAALWVAELLLIAQGLLGLVQLFGPVNVGRLTMHIVYGVVAVSCLPAAFRYNRGRATRWEALIFAFVCLFLLGVVGRAFQTAL